MHKGLAIGTLTAHSAGSRWEHEDNNKGWFYILFLQTSSKWSPQSQQRSAARFLQERSFISPQPACLLPGSPVTSCRYSACACSRLMASDRLPLSLTRSDRAGKHQQGELPPDLRRKTGKRLLFSRSDETDAGTFRSVLTQTGCRFMLREADCEGSLHPELQVF